MQRVGFMNCVDKMKSLHFENSWTVHLTLIRKIILEWRSVTSCYHGSKISGSQ